MPVAVRISSAVWLRAELPRQRRFIAGTGMIAAFAILVANSKGDDEDR